jgi:hypothetical protein
VSIFICWVLFPIVFCLLALGCGLLVQWASGGRMAGVLLLPVGFAAIVVASQITTYFDATTFLATPLVIVLALTGFVLGWRVLRPATCDLWAAAAALGVFCVYAAPVVLSGHATFLGYTLLGDTSIHFVLIDWVMKHGFHSLPNLPPSSTHSALASYLSTRYPLGAHTALGAVRPLVGQDVAWVFQPYIALLGTFTALSIYAILSRAIQQRWLLALAAFLAAQPGLVYAYALEASIKEVATICLIAMIVAVGAEFVTRRGGVRAVVPLAVVTAAGMGVLNASILVWLGPILLALLVGLLFTRGFHTWRSAALEAGVFAALAAALSFPALVVVNEFIGDTTQTFAGAGNNAHVTFGNLLGPLSPWQAFGVWPTGDFRLGLDTHVALTYVLIGLNVAAVLVGVIWALRRRTAWPLVFIAASAIGWAYITARSNAWGDAKALMIVSPALTAAAMMAPASLWSADRRPEAVLLALALAFGVLWTNVVAYHDAFLAPRDRLSELSKVGERFAGQGPTLYTEFEEFGKHFLRQADPSGSDESWQDNPRAAYVDGSGAPFGYSSDLDQLLPSYVQHFRTLVQRRAGSWSRPPSNYRLVYRGRFYDAWQKNAPSSRVVNHMPLGDLIQPGAAPKCSSVRALSNAGGTSLAYVSVPKLPVMMPTNSRHPHSWGVDPGDATMLSPYGAGTVTGSLTVTQPGRFAIWVEGTFNRPVAVIIDGRKVGTVPRGLNPRRIYSSAGSVTLQPGRHIVQLVRPGGDLYPGDGGHAATIGPLVLDPASDTRAVRQVPVSQWRQLCGQNLDWVESVR